MPNDWNTFDPHNLAFANFTLQQNLYDTLTRYDQNLKPLPGLAERWVVAPDGQSVTLTLRKGVKFHSGKDLVAADVVKNFEKAADKDRGINMFPAVTNVAEVTAPDPGTVLIKFKKVSPEVFDLLQAMAIIEPAAMDSLKNRGSGTGPFKFVEWVPGDHTTLERNPAYWGQGAPWVDRVVFKVFSDSDAMVAALQSGICDLIIAVPPEGHRAAGPRVQHGPRDARGPDLRDPGQRRQAAVRQEGGAPRAPLRHRPPGRGQQRALRRERADGAAVQPELARLRSVGRRRSTPSTSSGPRSSSRRPASPEAGRSA